MKSFVVACCIFAFVIGALIGNAAFVLRCTDALTDAAAQLPDNTHGDPAQYEIAMQSIRYIWKENRAAAQWKSAMDVIDDAAKKRGWID